MSNKLLTLCLTGSLVLPTGTAAQGAEVTIEPPTGPIELPQSLAVSPLAAPVQVERDKWTATTEKQLAAIRAAAAAIAARAEAKRIAAAKVIAAKAAAAKVARVARTAAIARAAGWRYPVAGNFTSRFGWRPQPVPGVNPFHAGLDIAAPCGTPVVAARAGRVVQSGWYGTYGNWVLIDHGNGIRTGYAHGSQNIVGVGQSVGAGQRIAYVGRTGAATGCHVHFEVRTNAGPIDPIRFMNLN